MRAISTVAFVMAIMLVSVHAQLPASYYENNFVNQIGSAIKAFNQDVATNGFLTAVSDVNSLVLTSVGQYVAGWTSTFTLDYNMLRTGMLFGTATGAAQAYWTQYSPVISTTSTYPTLSWSAPPSLLYATLSKIVTEVYHQVSTSETAFDQFGIDIFVASTNFVISVWNAESYSMGVYAVEIAKVLLIHKISEIPTV